MTESGPESTAPERKYHIQCSAGDVGEFVLLPGDPGRCDAIAKRFESPRRVAQNREYTTFTGTLGGVKVSVTSTGIGGPSAAIAMEELASLGAKTFIRVGTCGALSRKLKPGDLVIADSAVRNDGTSRQYLPVEFPAVATLTVLNALLSAAGRSHVQAYVGTVVSNDAFYREGELTLPGRETIWEQGNVLAAEMEAATLFTVARVRRLSVGAICMVSNTVAGDMPPPSSLLLEKLLDTAVDALGLLTASTRGRELSATS